MHTSKSGCGDVLVESDEEGIEFARRYLGYFPSSYLGEPPLAPAAAPASDRPIAELIPLDENKPFDMRELLDSLVDAGSFVEIHARWAREVIVGYARLDGRVIGIVANQPKVKGGVLFVDSADKGARFIWTCNAFNIPLLFLADVPGFMIGTQVEKEGIIRHGAKMISAVSEANVPKITVIVRKAYGAGLYAMAGPAFDPDCCLALPSASIAAMRLFANFFQPSFKLGGKACDGAQVGKRYHLPATPCQCFLADRAAATGVRRGHRHPPLGIRACGRCGDSAVRFARRADHALRAGGEQAPRVARQAKPGHAGVACLAGVRVAT